MLFNVILLAVVGLSTAEECMYKKISPEHTMCLPKKCPTLRSYMYKSEVALVMDTHNKLRSKVAMGQQPEQPPAANMKLLRWDDDLAIVAQKLADQCYNASSGVSPHDHEQNRKTFKHNSVGQNIAIRMSTAEVDFDVKEMIESFFNEVKDVKASYVAKYPDPLPAKIGHYTQLVWAKTDTVGCGISTYWLGKFYVLALVCNYGDSGNAVHMKIYEEGPACSKCTKGCSQKYAGLCL